MFRLVFRHEQMVCDPVQCTYNDTRYSGRKRKHDQDPFPDIAKMGQIECDEQHKRGTGDRVQFQSGTAEKVSALSQKALEDWAPNKNMNQNFMARAIELSIENVRSGRGGPFGAVIVKNDRIVAEAANRVTVSNDPTAHAEVVAIREACGRLGKFELADCEIYASCEPCPMCLGAIYWARLERIYFACVADDASKVGFDDSFLYRELNLPIERRRVPMVQLMREQALQAFQLWQEKPDKITY